jgi:hypothetical protein
LALFQAQTLGGVYSVVVLILRILCVGSAAGGAG